MPHRQVRRIDDRQTGFAAMVMAGVIVFYEDVQMTPIMAEQRTVGMIADRDTGDFAARGIDDGQVISTKIGHIDSASVP